MGTDGVAINLNMLYKRIAKLSCEKILWTGILYEQIRHIQVFVVRYIPMSNFERWWREMCYLCIRLLVSGTVSLAYSHIKVWSNEVNLRLNCVENIAIYVNILN